jgi:hypothetical protein
MSKIERLSLLGERQKIYDDWQAARDAEVRMRQQMRLAAEAMLNELQARGVTQRRVARRCKAPESMISNIRDPFVCSASSLPRFYLGIYKLWQEEVVQ